MYERVSFTCAFWDMFHLGILMEKFNTMSCDNRKEELSGIQWQLLAFRKEQC